MRHQCDNCKYEAKNKCYLKRHKIYSPQNHMNIPVITANTNFKAKGTQ